MCILMTSDRREEAEIQFVSRTSWNYTGMISKLSTSLLTFDSPLVKRDSPPTCIFLRKSAPRMQKFSKFSAENFKKFSAPMENSENTSAAVWNSPRETAVDSYIIVHTVCKFSLGGRLS